MHGRARIRIVYPKVVFHSRLHYAQWLAGTLIEQVHGVVLCGILFPKGLLFTARVSRHSRGFSSQQRLLFTCEGFSSQPGLLFTAVASIHSIGFSSQQGVLFTAGASLHSMGFYSQREHGLLFTAGASIHSMIFFAALTSIHCRGFSSRQWLLFLAGASLQQQGLLFARLASFHSRGFSSR